MKGLLFSLKLTDGETQRIFHSSVTSMIYLISDRPGTFLKPQQIRRAGVSGGA